MPPCPDGSTKAPIAPGGHTRAVRIIASLTRDARPALCTQIVPYAQRQAQECNGTTTAQNGYVHTLKLRRRSRFVMGLPALPAALSGSSADHSDAVARMKGLTTALSFGRQLGALPPHSAA
jgi:hypothetical protein